MKPTIEEVKNVAVECGFTLYSHPIAGAYCLHDEQLQAFVQYYIMVGRKIESDLMVEAAIRNNTGE